MKNLLLLTFSGLLFMTSAQQLQPADGATITRTSVLLEVPEVIGGVEYQYTIKASSGKSFIRNDNNHILIIDSLAFGESYQWEVVVLDTNKRVLTSYNQTFHIAASPLIDPTKNRFTIIQHSDSSQLDGLLFLDYNRVAINKNGTPVWFMPDIDYLRKKRLRDFKLTNRGTLTYLDILNCEELNLDGEAIWRTPSTGEFTGDTTDYYHHEFTRLSNGNYLVLGKQFVSSDLVIEGKEIKQLPLSIIIEYNPEGEVVWTWSSNQYVTNEDILAVGQKVGMGNTFGHMNSFYLDEATGIIYAGFRDLNCILAIDKKSGVVLESYGDKIPSDTTSQGIGFFKKQHAPIKLPGNKLLLFNNNDRNETSSVQILSEVTPLNNSAEIIWEFYCDFDTLRPGASSRMGNALPLSNKHILVNTGASGRIFEVTPDKKVLWQCLPEKWNESSRTWTSQPNYRVYNSSSLYPYYHTISLHESQLRISNEGSNEDDYLVHIYSNPKKKKKAHRFEISIDQNAQEMIDLTPYISRKSRKRPMYIEVLSKNNPDLVIQRSYTVY